MLTRWAATVANGGMRHDGLEGDQQGEWVCDADRGVRASRRIKREGEARTNVIDEVPERVTSEETGRRLVYFAAERTLMAWIRCSLGLMALGFVVDRFGLVLRLALPHVGPQVHSKAFSFWAGTVLVLVGAAMAVVAAIRYLRFAVSYHRRGSTSPRRGILVGALFSAIVALLGAVIAAYLSVTTG
ncbi:MAG: DUF202 domain-containing protein [Proteobacteria bacterium]|nr:DUF202 domain-containing protein [Pseudomonadota bacterium]